MQETINEVQLDGRTSNRRLFSMPTHPPFLPHHAIFILYLFKIILIIYIENLIELRRCFDSTLMMCLRKQNKNYISKK